MKTSYTSLEELKKEALPLIEKQLDDWLTIQKGPQQGLEEAARYSTLQTGKRFRPLLTLIVASKYHTSFDIAIPAACSIELIHNYSLIHDDLPCMDDDDYRRGKKALHKVVGEGLALLTGDFLLTLAFQVISHCEKIPMATRLEMIKRVAVASGHEGMVGGQYADLTCHQHPQTREFLQWMHLCKTGALMRASMELGALVSNLDASLVTRWGLFGEQFGLLFQLVDDLIDSLPGQVEASTFIGLSSYITFAGVEQTLKEVQELKAKLLLLAHELDPDRSILIEIIEAVTRQYEELPQIANIQPIASSNDC